MKKNDNSEAMCLHTFLITKTNPGDIYLIYEKESVIGAVYTMNHDDECTIALPKDILGKNIVSVDYAYGKLTNLRGESFKVIKVNVDD